MVGKVNVGKSNLFEVAFPKGRNENINIGVMRNKARFGSISGVEDRYEDEIALRQHEEVQEAEDNKDLIDDADLVEEGSDLLPPARAETPYPVMPTVSSLPGTTASPIRIPFGGGRGELVDLPGLARSDLDTFVKPEDRDSLVMKHRITPEQYTIKTGQSLLLGGLIRIDPYCPAGWQQKELTILAYPFVPLRPHLTSVMKADEIQSGARVSGVPMVVDDAGRKAMQSAGRFQLKWDVTKQRAGPLTTASGVGLKAKVLPFSVLSTDILVEGIGWVELVAQVRKRKVDPVPIVVDVEPDGVIRGESEADDELRSIDDKETSPHLEKDENYEKEAHNADEFPEVEVFSPNGMGIGARRPMGAWLLGGAKPTTVANKRSRPRRSMANSR